MRLVSAALILAGLVLVGDANAQEINPVVGGFGTVFPTITETAIEISRDYPSNDPGEWFATFDLITTANVRLGASVLSPFFESPTASLTNIRLVTIEGDNVAFGTDEFSNPFPSPTARLVSVDSLAPGKYALGVSGSGNRYQRFFDLAGTRVDKPDFAVRLQVIPIPEPSTLFLLLTAIVSFCGVQRLSRRMWST